LLTFCRVQGEYDTLKSKYESVAASLESALAKEEKLVRAYREEVASDESRYHYLHTMIRRVQHQVWAGPVAHPPIGQHCA
jgi:hypothetical protein